MKAKKLISMLLVSVMALGLLAGCGSREEAQTDEPQEEVQNDADIAIDTETDTETATGEGGNTLVVYFSATGNTEKVAKVIADTTGGDLFELEPVEPYSDADLDWSDEDSRVSVEHENEDQRDVELVADTVDNWESYDTVFIGYPIWWAEAAWPVNNFVKANDFTGKIVIPFATSSSSELGESGELLAEMAGTGEWLAGERFRSRASEADVQDWVASYASLHLSR